MDARIITARNEDEACPAVQLARAAVATAETGDAVPDGAEAAASSGGLMDKMTPSAGTAGHAMDTTLVEAPPAGRDTHAPAASVDQSASSGAHVASVSSARSAAGALRCMHAARRMRPPRSRVCSAPSDVRLRGACVVQAISPVQIYKVDEETSGRTWLIGIVARIVASLRMHRGEAIVEQPRHAPVISCLAAATIFHSSFVIALAIIFFTAVSHLYKVNLASPSTPPAAIRAR